MMYNMQSVAQICNSSERKMKIATILMDIDGTMTEKLPGSESVQSDPLKLLIPPVVQKFGISDSEAEIKIRSCGDIEKRCISEVLPQLGIEKSLYFNVMRDAMKKKIIITPDTLRFFRKMKEINIPVCTASTNSVFMSLAKLSAAGIADLNGCSFIAKYHPGCEFGDPEGKFSPDYFPAILRNHGYDPERTMMIGDEPKRDLYPARNAGIRYCVIIDRKQNEPVLRKDGAVFINSLDILTVMIQEETL